MWDKGKENSGESAVGSRQWAVDSGQLTVGSFQLVVFRELDSPYSILPISSIRL